MLQKLESLFPSLCGIQECNITWGLARNSNTTGSQECRHQFCALTFHIKKKKIHYYWFLSFKQVSSSAYREMLCSACSRKQIAPVDHASTPYHHPLCYETLSLIQFCQQCLTLFYQNESSQPTFIM